MPAVAPRDPPVLVLTGKTLGDEDTQLSVGEFVRSLTEGGVANVPIARNCPVSCNWPTVIELGIMVRLRIVSGVPPPPAEAAVTTMVALELVGPLYASAVAVIVTVPVPTPVARPEALTVAMEGELEVQVTVLVTSFVEGWFALPNVPTALN